MKHLLLGLFVISLLSQPFACHCQSPSFGLQITSGAWNFLFKQIWLAIGLISAKFFRPSDLTSPYYSDPYSSLPVDQYQRRSRHYPNMQELPLRLLGFGLVKPNGFWILRHFREVLLYNIKAYGVWICRYIREKQYDALYAFCTNHFDVNYVSETRYFCLLPHLPMSEGDD